MARRTLHLVVQQEEPSKDSLWINPYNGVARIYAQNKGWLPLQGPLFVQLNDKVDTEVATLTGRIEEDEKSIKTNAEDIAKLKTSKQDALTEGYGISIAEDGTISCTVDTSVFVFKETLPDRPDEGKEDKIYIVPSGDGSDSNLCDEWVWVEDGGGRWELFGSATLSLDLSGYVTKTAFEELEERVRKLEGGESGGAGGDITALESRVTALENEVRSLDIPSIEEMDDADVDTAWDETMNG